MGQYIPRRIAVRALLILAFLNVLPDALRIGTLGCHGAYGASVFVMGTLSGVVEKDEAFLVQLRR
jgi:hypothetical protein